MIIVLGFDGLGLEFVRELGLDVVKQKAYTATDLSDFATHPFTPIIWASMLTGYKVKEMEEIYIELTRKPLMRKIAQKCIPYRLRAVLGRLYDRAHGGSNTEVTAMKVLMSYLKEHDIPTIFEELQEKGIKYWHNHIPGYNGVPRHEEHMRVVSRALSGDKSAYREYKQLIWAQHQNEVRKFLEALEEGREFYFFYTNLIDALGHLFYPVRKERKKMAMAVEEVVQTVKESYPDAVIYIISDHGMAVYDGIPDHSHSGFFSSNTGELIGKPFKLYHLLKRRLL